MKYNGNKFSVYGSEEKTVLGLLDELGSQVNHNTDQLNTKTDLHGNHLGAWQGLNRPTLSDEGMRSVVEKLECDYKNINDSQQNLNNEILELKNENINFNEQINMLSKNLNIEKENLLSYDENIDINRDRNSYYSTTAYLEHANKLNQNGKMNSFPTMVKFNDKIIVCYREGNDHVSNDGVIKQVTSIDGGLSWSTPQTILSESSYDLRDPNLYKLNDGLLLVITKRYSNETREVKVYKSVDGGLSWVYKCNLPNATGSNGNMQVRGNAVIMNDGSIIIPCYYQTTWGVYLVKSVDGGNSFHFLSWVSKNTYDETSLMLTGNGEQIIAVMRKNGEGNGAYCISNDGGVNWSLPSDIGYVVQAPMLLKNKDYMLIFFRNPNTLKNQTGKVEFNCLPFSLKSLKPIGTPILLDSSDNWDISYSWGFIENRKINLVSYNVNDVFFSKFDLTVLTNVDNLTKITKENKLTYYHNIEGVFETFKKTVEVSGMIQVIGNGTNAKTVTVTLPFTAKRFLHINANVGYTDIDGNYNVNVGRCVGNTLNFVMKHIQGNNWSTEKFIFFNLKAIL